MTANTTAEWARNSASNSSKRQECEQSVYEQFAAEYLINHMQHTHNFTLVRSTIFLHLVTAKLLQDCINV